MIEWYELMMGIISLLIPKRMAEWMKKQSEAVRKVLYYAFWVLSVFLVVLLVFILWGIYAIIANTFFGGNYSIADFPTSWLSR